MGILPNTNTNTNNTNDIIPKLKWEEILRKIISMKSLNGHFSSKRQDVIREVGTPAETYTQVIGSINTKLYT